MKHAPRHEPIGRAIGGSRIAVMTMADVVLRTNPDYPQFQTFHCSTLRCDISPSACATNYTRVNAPISCKGCAVGHAQAGDTPTEMDRHANADAARALACIRCEKSAHTNKRLIGRMRLVRSGTLCVSCFNRLREFEKGANSKGGMPRLVLFPAIITIQTTEGKQKTLDIGLRLDYLECARYVERVHPGATLIETAIGGEITPQFSLWTPLPFSPWEPGMVRNEKPSKPKRTYTHRGTPRTSKKTSAVASPVDWDDWDTPLYAKPASRESTADGNGNARLHGWLPSMSEVDDAAYRASFNEPALDPDSIAAHGFGDSDGLPEFIEWLTDGWPVPVIEVGSEAKPSLSGLAKAHGISAALAHYRLRARGTVEFPLDPNGSVLHTRNKSGINGVRWVAKRNKWYARGHREGRHVHLGYFDTIEEAAAARAKFDNKHFEPPAPVAETLNEAVAQLMEAGESIGHIGLLLDIPRHVAERCVEDVIAALEDAPAEPSTPVTNAIALPEVAEPISEPQDKPAQAIAPVRDPIAEAIRKLEAIKNPSRKVRRELGRLYEKQERRAGRQQREPRHAPNPMPAKQTAIAARAYALLQDSRA
jgi:hypothetical protein